MATFITTIKFTAQGLAGVQDTTKRVAAFRASATQLGVKVTATYWTLGKYDGLLILEAPDDETATSLMLQLATQGNVQTSTVRAFTSAEMEKILTK